MALIDDALDGPERKAMLCKLHADHMALLFAVERQKIDAKSETEIVVRDRLLRKVSAPITFLSKKTGEPTYMETPWITRAKELVALYRSMMDRSYSKAERLDLLLSVTITVSVGNEIVQLHCREAHFHRFLIGIRL